MALSKIAWALNKKMIRMFRSLKNPLTKEEKMYKNIFSKIDESAFDEFHDWPALVVAKHNSFPVSDPILSDVFSKSYDLIIKENAPKFYKQFSKLTPEEKKELAKLIIKSQPGIWRESTRVNKKLFENINKIEKAHLTPVKVGNKTKKFKPETVKKYIKMKQKQYEYINQQEAKRMMSGQHNKDAFLPRKDIGKKSKEVGEKYLPGELLYRGEPAYSISNITGANVSIKAPDTPIWGSPHYGGAMLYATKKQTRPRNIEESLESMTARIHLYDLRKTPYVKARKGRPIWEVKSYPGPHTARPEVVHEGILRRSIGLKKHISVFGRNEVDTAIDFEQVVPKGVLDKTKVTSFRSLPTGDFRATDFDFKKLNISKKDKKRSIKTLNKLKTATALSLSGFGIGVSMKESFDNKKRKEDIEWSKTAEIYDKKLYKKVKRKYKPLYTKTFNDRSDIKHDLLFYAPGLLTVGMNPFYLTMGGVASALKTVMKGDRRKQYAVSNALKNKYSSKNPIAQKAREIVMKDLAVPLDYTWHNTGISLVGALIGMKLGNKIGHKLFKNKMAPIISSAVGGSLGASLSTIPYINHVKEKELKTINTMSRNIEKKASVADIDTVRSLYEHNVYYSAKPVFHPRETADEWLRAMKKDREKLLKTKTLESKSKYMTRTALKHTAIGGMLGALIGASFKASTLGPAPIWSKDAWKSVGKSALKTALATGLFSGIYKGVQARKAYPKWETLYKYYKSDAFPKDLAIDKAYIDLYHKYKKNEKGKNRR